MKYHRIRKYPTHLSFTTGLLLLGVGMPISPAEAIECGDILARGPHKLTGDVICVDVGDPALTLESGADLDLDGYTVDCNETGREGIVLQGKNAQARDGFVLGCRNGVKVNDGGNHTVLRLIVEDSERDGVNVSSDGNQLLYVEARGNNRRGFNIGGDNNNVARCLAEDNGRQGFIIDEGNGNRISNSMAFSNCRDGMEIDDDGADNSLANNYVADNGNSDTCAAFGEDYRPWFYAGIDITEGAENNTVTNNRTSGNQGCNGEGCAARERNLLDENPDCDGNAWPNNRANGVTAEPECG